MKNMTKAQILEENARLRRRIEAIERSEGDGFATMHRTIFESAQDGMLLCEKDGTIIEVNPAACRMHGYSRDELVGTNAARLVHPDSLADFSGFLDTSSSDDQFTASARDVRKDGSPLQVEVRGSPMVFEGRPHLLAILRDVTEQKRVIENLRRSEARYRTLVENLPQKIFMKDRDFKWVSINPLFASDLGIPPEEVLGKVDGDFFPAELAAKYRADDERIMSADVKDEFDEEYVEGGRQRTVHTIKTPVKDDEGRIIGVLGVFWDVTEQKEAERDRDAAQQQLQAANQQLRAANQQLRATEQQLRASNQQLEAANQQLRSTETSLRESEQTARALMDATYDAAILIDTEGTILASNEIHARRLERSRGDLLGENVYGLLPPDIAERRRAWMEQVVRTGEPLEEEDNQAGFILHNTLIPLFDRKGDVDRVAVFSRDITERKRAEAELEKHRSHLEDLVEERTAELEESKAFTERILRDAPVGIVVYRQDGSCVSVNDLAPGLVGATREQMLEQNFREITSWRESGLFDCAERTLATRQTHQIDVEVTTTFGRDVHLACRFGTFDAGDEPHLLLIFTDITDLKHTESALRTKTVELQASNAELESFAYSVSHDLRAPLRAIEGFSQAMLEDYADRLDDGGKRYLNIVSTETQRMAQLISDLLTLSRVSRAEMRGETVDLSLMVRDAMERMRQIEPDRDVETSVAGDVQARGDLRLLRQVVDNLVGNAWKFTSKNPDARIEFGTTEVEEERAFFVRDNGVGFDIKYADKLFTPFQRLHGMKEFPGTGIGLSTVRRIVRRHGGRTWIESEPGKGTTCYFTLHDEGGGT